MVKLIIIKKTGSIKSSNIKLSTLDDLYKKCGFSSNSNFSKRHTWEMENEYYSLYSKDNGKAGSENKFELPPPVDKELYFGKMVFLKHTNEEISLEKIKDFDLKTFEKLYNFTFGGFDDIESSEEESVEEEVDPKNLTKEGYDKSDGFIVDDDDFEDILSSESNDLSCDDEETDDEEKNDTEDDNEIDEEDETDDDTDNDTDDDYLSEESFISEEDDDDYDEGSDDEEDDEGSDDEEDDEEDDEGSDDEEDMKVEDIELED